MHKHIEVHTNYIIIICTIIEIYMHTNANISITVLQCLYTFVIQYKITTFKHFFGKFAMYILLLILSMDVHVIYVLTEVQSH